MILVSLMDQPWVIFLIILVIFGALVLGVFLFKKYFFDPRHSDNLEKPTEEQIVEDELNSYLVDLDDDQQAFFDKEIENNNSKVDDKKEDN